MKLTTIILTKKVGADLEKTIKSVGFSDEILTVEKNSITDFSLERNKAMTKAKGEWILFIDADEEVTQQLRIEISRVILNSVQDLNQMPKQVRHDNVAYRILRRDFFWGKELRWGELRKTRELGIIRLMRKNSGKWGGKVHEEFMAQGRVGKLKGFINHYPHQTLKEFLHEVNFYSTLKAVELQENGSKVGIFTIIFFPFVKFIYVYFFKLGFLDGPAGFTYAFLMSFHSFLVRSKLYQYTKIDMAKKLSS